MEKVVLCFAKKSWELQKFESDFLYSYFLRFSTKNNLELFEKRKIVLSKRKLMIFRECFFQALEDLVNDCYEEPSIRQRQKHSLAMRKVVFENRMLTVNYRTSLVGTLIFYLNCRLDDIDKLIEEGRELVVLIK